MTLHKTFAATGRRTRQALAITSLLLATTASHATISSFTSGAAFFKQVVTNNEPQTTTSAVLAALPGASTTVFVPAGTTVLIGASFSAETRCSGGANGQSWCEASIDIGGTEGYPQATTTGAGTFAFDSTDGGTETTSSWEAHGLSRHRCITNRGTGPLPVKVVVNWRISNAAANPTDFWVDDSSLVVEMSRDCKVPVGTDSAAKFGADAAPSTHLEQK